MKVTLVVLSLACFIGVLHALPIDEESHEIELKPQVLPNFEEEVPEEEDDARRPIQRPTRRPPQIHHNAVRSQGPFSGRLVNVVANRQGIQNTVQTNSIEYNLNAFRRNLDDLLENADPTILEPKTDDNE